MSIADVAAHFRCSVPTVRARLIPEGLPYYRVGNRWRFRREDVQAFEEELSMRRGQPRESNVIQLRRSSSGVD
ncbi:MAG: helix-turn-helix domain-containing protein [Candidatus Omnitrophica bacterium]|nr:helix-turn-helix domain-containing protein [Candidatus Omnitrophota bacterium]